MIEVGAVVSSQVTMDLVALVPRELNRDVSLSEMSMTLCEQVMLMEHVELHSLCVLLMIVLYDCPVHPSFHENHVWTGYSMT